MRVLSILALVTFCSSFALANEATDALGISPKFPGTYTLEKAKGGGAQYHCDQTVELIVTEHSVQFGRVSFHIADAGCKKTEGDIGPVRVSCTKFSERKISDSLTEPLTIVGYVSEQTSLRLSLFDDTKLVFSHDVDQVPFGILGIWNEDKFKCTYKRME